MTELGFAQRSRRGKFKEPSQGSCLINDYAPGDAPGSVSREHAVTVSRAGVVSITGGKLTTYRVMAADVLREVCRALGRPNRASGDERLPGGDIDSFDSLVAEISRETGDAALGAHHAGSFGSRWRAAFRDWSRNSDARPGYGRQRRAGWWR